MAKVKICVLAFNRPDLIKLQRNSFEAFIEDDHQMIVVNNAKSSEDRQAIAQACKDAGVAHDVVKGNNESDLWMHNAWGLNYAYRWHLQNHKGIGVLAHHDVFPVAPLSIGGMIGDAGIAGVFEHYTTCKPVGYPWPVWIVLSPALPSKSDVCFGLVHGGDTGSWMEWYIGRCGVDCVRLSRDRLGDGGLGRVLCELGYRDEYGGDMIAECLLHAGKVSGWSGDSGHSNFFESIVRLRLGAW